MGQVACVNALAYITALQGVLEVTMAYINGTQMTN